LSLPSLMVSVMNGRRMGGGFLMAPESKPDDRLFDVCVAGHASKPVIFSLIPRFMRGTQASHPAIQFLRTAWISVAAMDGVLPAHADGETICMQGKHLTMELLPAALEVICQKETT
jgi:diacylglycerol kinase (ATP)